MADYLKHFTDALYTIVREIGFNDVEIENGTTDSDSIELLVTVGITGDLHGFMMIRSDMNSAYNFITRMLSNMGVEPEEEEGFGQFHKEAMGEIVNQISGRSIMHLADASIDCNITPPTIISGQGIYSNLDSCEASISHILRGSFGTLGIFVGIKKSELKINS